MDIVKIYREKEGGKDGWGGKEGREGKDSLTFAL